MVLPWKITYLKMMSPKLFFSPRQSLNGYASPRVIAYFSLIQTEGLQGDTKEPFFLAKP